MEYLRDTHFTIWSLLYILFAFEAKCTYSQEEINMIMCTIKDYKGLYRPNIGTL